MGWGAVRLRFRRRRPPVDSVAFFAYRREWNLAIKEGFGLDVRSAGPRPTAGTLLVSNHSGFADINVLVCECPAEARLNFVSKIEIGNIPVFGWHMRRYGDVLFDRRDPQARKAVIDTAVQRLQRGFSVAVFPEGTRSRDGTPKAEIRPALVDAAIRAGAPVQPVAITGTLGLFEDVRMPKRGRKIRLRFGQPRTTFANAGEVWAEVRRLWDQARADP